MNIPPEVGIWLQLNLRALVEDDNTCGRLIAGHRLRGRDTDCKNYPRAKSARRGYGDGRNSRFRVQAISAPDQEAPVRRSLCLLAPGKHGRRPLWAQGGPAGAPLRLRRCFRPAREQGGISPLPPRGLDQPARALRQLRPFRQQHGRKAHLGVDAARTHDRETGVRRVALESPARQRAANSRPSGGVKNNSSPSKGLPGSKARATSPPGWLQAVSLRKRRYKRLTRSAGSTFASAGRSRGIRCVAGGRRGRCGRRCRRSGRRARTWERRRRVRRRRRRTAGA